MAKIAIVRLFYGMTITGAQLAGQLKAKGHDAKVIFFKKQEIVPAVKAGGEDFQLGDIPMQNYTINKNGSELLETSVWKRTKPQELKHLLKLIEEFSPDAIGISTLSLGMSLAAEVTAFLREHSKLPILWGGTGPTIEPERSIQHADLVCVGEGEDVIIEIAERLDMHKSLDGISGTWFRLPDGQIQKNPNRPVSDLEQIATPDWNESTFAYVNGPRLERIMKPDAHSFDKSYQIMTQRGCPFSCSFCVESYYQLEFGKQGSLRRMSPQKAITELLYAKNILGYTTVTFMDDVFTVNPRWLKEFLPLYKKEIALPFFCYTYPTTHNPEMLSLLADSGCHAITMGIQSGSQRILTEVFDRPTKLGRVVEAAREIVDSGIPAATFDMIPHTEFDTEDDLRETLMILLEIPKEIDTTFYGKMAYFPNYPIMNKFKDDKLIAQSQRLPEDTYLYYFKLFDLTRSRMDKEQILSIYHDPAYRKNHELLNQFLGEAGTVKASYGTLTELGIQRRALIGTAHKLSA